MDTRAALLRAILDRPDNDGPRLALADWCEDNGDPAEAARVRWFLARPDYRQGASIQYAVPGWPERDRGRAEPCCVIHRAFVAEVRLPLAAFAGGPCGCRTRNSGRVVPASHSLGTPHCPDCDRTGDTPGLAAELFRRHPITRVVPTDREPTQNTRHHYWMWVRESGMSTAPRDELPSALFDFLPLLTNSHYHVFGLPGDWRSYPTREAALDALSAACVAYGRSLAGLA